MLTSPDITLLRTTPNRHYRDIDKKIFKYKRNPHMNGNQIVQIRERNHFRTFYYFPVFIYLFVLFAYFIDFYLFFSSWTFFARTVGEMLHDLDDLSASKSSAKSFLFTWNIFFSFVCENCFDGRQISFKEWFSSCLIRIYYQMMSS